MHLIFSSFILLILSGFTLAQLRPKPASTPTVLSAATKKKIEQATPKALPQESKEKKETSDAQDDRIKGKVKTVTEESIDLTDGPWSKYGRHFTEISEYDTRGDMLKQIRFDASGRPFEVMIFGYIDGFRVMRSGSIVDDKTMFTTAGPAAPPPVPPHAPDPRFEYKVVYKYAAGKLIETQTFYNNGLKGNRSVYIRNGNILEKVDYTENGEPNQKYQYVLDEKGNEIERISFEVRPGMPTRPEIRCPVKNEAFDKEGNWIERTRYLVEIENGKAIEKPLYKEYRTITYHP